MRLHILFITAVTLLAADDAREIIRHSVDSDRRNYKLAENYTFIERQETRTLDSHGAVKRRTVKTYDITLTEGSPYRRLIARDDKPLPPDEQRKEQRKLEKSIAQRRAETPQQRAKRLENWRKERKRSREFLAELPEAFDFRLFGGDTFEGHKCYMIEAQPRPGYRPKTSAGRFLPKVKGKLWIDAATYDWVRVEAETIGTISLGGIALRLSPGSRLTFTQTWVNNEIWLPQRVRVNVAGRVFLLMKVAAEVETTFSGYKKFQTDSRIVSVEENQ
jgi:hypothetical protein